MSLPHRKQVFEGIFEIFDSLLATNRRFVGPEQHVWDGPEN
ncbi:hypothetical protein [Methanobacterium sp.]